LPKKKKGNFGGKEKRKKGKQTSGAKKRTLDSRGSKKWDLKRGITFVAGKKEKGKKDPSANGKEREKTSSRWWREKAPATATTLEKNDQSRGGRRVSQKKRGGGMSVVKMIEFA